MSALPVVAAGSIGWSVEDEKDGHYPRWVGWVCCDQSVPGTALVEAQDPSEAEAKLAKSYQWPSLTRRNLGIESNEKPAGREREQGELPHPFASHCQRG